MEDIQVVAWLLMALGVAELFGGIFLRQKGVSLEPGPNDAAGKRRKAGLIKSGMFVAVSGAIMVLVGIVLPRVM